jgi:hypothetical protein
MGLGSSTASAELFVAEPEREAILRFKALEMMVLPRGVPDDMWRSSEPEVAADPSQGEACGMITHLLLDEPELEFGDGGTHIDPRLGLLNHDPLQPILGDRISIGVIGTSETVEGFERWLERARTGIAGASAKQPNLFPPFPGLGNENPFRCPFQINPTAKRVPPKRDITDLVSIQNNAEAVREASTLFTDKATTMHESSDKDRRGLTLRPNHAGRQRHH